MPTLIKSRVVSKIKSVEIVCLTGYKNATLGRNIYLLIPHSEGHELSKINIMTHLWKCSPFHKNTIVIFLSVLNVLQHAYMCLVFKNQLLMQQNTLEITDTAQKVFVYNSYRNLYKIHY